MIKLVIIRGLPGSGKSTMGKTLYPDHVHVEADMFFLKHETYTYDPTKIKEAHEWCKNKVKETLMTGKSVVVTNTFVKRWEFKWYTDLAEQLGITCLVKVATGNYTNIHDVPQEVIERMRTNWEH